MMKQDLILFSNQSCIDSAANGIWLINSMLATQPIWLINAIMETVIKGVPNSINSSSNLKEPVGFQRGSTVTLCSFIHEIDYYQVPLSKISNIDSNQYNIIDFMSNYIKNKNFINNTNNSPSSSRNIDALQKIVDDFPNFSNMIILDHPELLLSLIGCSSIELWNGLIKPLQLKCDKLLISNSIEWFNLDLNDPINSNNIETKETVELNKFLLNCLHQCVINLTIKPLSTGYAKDISGTLTITRGGQPLNLPIGSSLHIIENEYLYLNEKESTKLFYA